MTATPTARLREAAGVCREEATVLARQPAPSLVGEHPDLDAAIDHLKAGREMKIRYALAAMFDAWAFLAEHDPDQLDRVGGPETLALADAILAAVPR